MPKNILVITAYALVLGLFSCSSENAPTKKPFTEVADFNEISTRIPKNQELIKQVFVDGKIESKEVKDVQWQQELHPFIDANFNNPSTANDYNKSITTNELGGWQDVIFTTKNKNLPVQKAIYRYQDSTLLVANLTVSKNSKAYQFSESLTYIPQMGYSIKNAQNLELVAQQFFHLQGEFKNKPQPYRVSFNIGSISIPVNMQVTKKDHEIELTFIQGKEKITVFAQSTDSGWVASMPVFNSYMVFTMKNNTLSGNFHNLDRGPDYQIPFTAQKLPYNQVYGLDTTQNIIDFSGKWETYFASTGGQKDLAMGLFSVTGSDIVGTFATETGDYRFLQGKVVADSFYMSTFDGSHLYLFTAKIKGDSIVNGHFYSGNHYSTTWDAKRNNQLELTDPTQMTQVKNGLTAIDFTFPDLNHQMVSLSDPEFADKVVIIQILGSWCPNCMDETRYFVDLYTQYHTRGLEIIGLAFERSAEFEEAKIPLQKALTDLNVPYPVLIAGTPRTSADALPMITKIKSYPTSIFINKKGEVVKIHTGFYGPSTGKFYTNYVQETEQFIDSLLNE